MRYSTRARLIIGFVGVSLLVGLVSLLVGGQLLYDSVLNEANNRVRQDLNVARVIYDDRIQAIQLALETATMALDFRDAVASADAGLLNDRLERISRLVFLDFAGVTAGNGEMICRLSGDGFSRPVNPLAGAAMENLQPVAGTVILDRDVLDAEGSGLADKARIEIRLRTADRTVPGPEETGGLAIGAAIPLFDNGTLLGTVYGGVLLNRNPDIVDKINGTVFRNETYSSRNVGTATVFFRNLRVTTTVLETGGQRAVGTLAESAVTRRVLEEGARWTDRAFVVNDWYITAYEPIADIRGNRVGMLYVGVLEAKYSDVRRKALLVFTAITFCGVVLAIALGWLVASRIMRPVNELIRASIAVSEGNLTPRIGPIVKSDIGLLQKNFKIMTEAIRQREARQRHESETRLIQSEKHASVGKLAAGVAHEINNPLTAVLTFTHLILRRKDLPAEVRNDLQTIAIQTDRVRKIVRELLDFSRQTRLDREEVDLNRVMEDCIRLMENQALVRGAALHFKPTPDLQRLRLDRSQFQSVIVNMILNALDAMEPGGDVFLGTHFSRRANEDGVSVTVRDTGHGILPEHLDKLFDPFFTTKEVGKGTGLGLAVSAGIVARHGGTIDVRSRIGAGTTFTIWLPLRYQAHGDSRP